MTGSMYHKELKGSEVKSNISENGHKVNLLFSSEEVEFAFFDLVIVFHFFFIDLAIEILPYHWRFGFIPQGRNTNDNFYVKSLHFIF